MSILNKLRNVRKEYFIREHPLATKDISFRYSYVIGCGIMAAVDGEIGEVERTRINELVLSMRLTEDYIEKVIGIIATIEETMMKEIVQSLLEKWEQYVFIIDLYKIAQSDGDLNEAEQEVIAIFSELLQLSEEEQDFFQNFAIAMNLGDERIAEQALQSAYKDGFELPIEAFRYFMPGLKEVRNENNEQKTYTQEEVDAIYKARVESIVGKLRAMNIQINREIADYMIAEVVKNAEAVTVTQIPVEKKKDELTPEKKAELIAAVETKMAEIKASYKIEATKSLKNFYIAHDRYRALEEYVTELKGKSIERLVKEKYNGYTRADSRAVSKITESSTALLDSIITSVLRNN